MMYFYPDSNRNIFDVNGRMTGKITKVLGDFYV